MGFNYFCKAHTREESVAFVHRHGKHCMVWPVTFLQIQKCALKPLFYNHRLSIDVNGRDGQIYSGCPVHCYFYGNVKGWKKLEFTWTIANGATTKFKIVLYCRYLTQKTLFAVGFCFSWGALAIEIMSTTGSKPSCRCPVVLRVFIWSSFSLYN